MSQVEDKRRGGGGSFFLSHSRETNKSIRGTGKAGTSFRAHVFDLSSTRLNRPLEITQDQKMRGDRNFSKLGKIGKKNLSSRYRKRRPTPSVFPRETTVCVCVCVENVSKRHGESYEIADESYIIYGIHSACEYYNRWLMAPHH